MRWLRRMLSGQRRPENFNFRRDISVYLILGAFILATAMVKTRLAERITYLILARFGTSPTRITLGVTPSISSSHFSCRRPRRGQQSCCGMLFSASSIFGPRPLALCDQSASYLAFTNATIGAGVLTATVPNPVTVEFIAKPAATPSAMPNGCFSDFRPL